MNAAVRVSALLDAALAAEVVRSRYTYTPKDIGALPALAASDRAGSVALADEFGEALSSQATVTFYLVTEAEASPQTAFDDSDEALAALDPLLADNGWQLTRWRQVEATWGDRTVIVCQLFLSSTL